MRKLLILLAAILVFVLGLWGTAVLYFDEERLKQIAIEQVRAQTGRELRIDGPLNLSFLPRISLVANDVSLSGPQDFDGPDLFQADQLRLAVELWPLIRGEVETGDIALENARLVVHTDRAGRSSLDGLAGASAEGGGAADTPAAEPGAQARPAVSTGAIALSQTRLEVSDAATDSRQVFVVERLEINSFAFDSPIRFEFEGAIGEPPMVENIDVNGTLVVPSGDGPIEVTELGMTARAAGLPMGLTGRATLNPGPPLLASFSDGVLDLNGKEFQTSFSYRDGARPSIDARLQGDELNVDALLAALPPIDESAAPEDEDAESPLLLLREFDVDARVQLQKMIASGLELTDVQARLNARNGVVTVDPLSGVLQGGRIDAVAMADLTVEPPVVQIDPVFDLSSVAEALEPWGMDRFVTGSGLLELGLSARGLDPKSLLGSLNGTGRYEFRDGSIQGLNLDGMVEALAARDVAAAVQSGVGGSTSFESLIGQIEVKDGTIRMPGMNLATNLLGVSGDVRIGLADFSLEGQLRLDGERVNNIPIALDGTLLSPKITPDIGAAVKQEAGRRVMDFLRDRTRDDEEEEGNGGG